MSCNSAPEYGACGSVTTAVRPMGAATVRRNREKCPDVLLREEGVSASGSTRSPAGSETSRMSPTVAWAYSQEDTSPAGTVASAAFSRLTVMRPGLVIGGRGQAVLAGLVGAVGQFRSGADVLAGPEGWRGDRRAGAAPGRWRRWTPGGVGHLHVPPYVAVVHAGLGVQTGLDGDQGVGHQRVDLVPGGVDLGARMASERCICGREPGAGSAGRAHRAGRQAQLRVRAPVFGATGASG